MQAPSFKPSITVQVSSQDSSALLLSTSEQKEIQTDLSRECTLTWLPGEAPPRGLLPKTERGALEWLQLLLVVASSSAIGATFKGFFESLGSEAGKTTWRTLTRVVSKTLGKKVGSNYRLGADATILVDVGGCHIGLKLTKVEDVENEHSREIYEREITEDLGRVPEDLPKHQEQLIAELERLKRQCDPASPSKSHRYIYWLLPTPDLGDEPISDELLARFLKHPRYRWLIQPEESSGFAPPAS